MVAVVVLSGFAYLADDAPSVVMCIEKVQERVTLSSCSCLNSMSPPSQDLIHCEALFLKFESQFTSERNCFFFLQPTKRHKVAEGHPEYEQLDRFLTV